MKMTKPLPFMFILMLVSGVIAVNVSGIIVSVDLDMFDETTELTLLCPVLHFI